MKPNPPFKLFFFITRHHLYMLNDFFFVFSLKNSIDAQKKERKNSCLMPVLNLRLLPKLSSSSVQRWKIFNERRLSYDNLLSNENLLDSNLGHLPSLFILRFHFVTTLYKHVCSPFLPSVCILVLRCWFAVQFCNFLSCTLHKYTSCNFLCPTFDILFFAPAQFDLFERRILLPYWISCFRVCCKEDEKNSVSSVTFWCLQRRLKRFWLSGLVF